MNTVEIGREAEFRTAQEIWQRFMIPTFPCPLSQADLITHNGILIEVKSNGQVGAWNFNPNQIDPEAFDICVCWYKSNAFVIPRQQLPEQLCRINVLDVQEWQGRWDIVEMFEAGRAETVLPEFKEIDWKGAGLNMPAPPKRVGDMWRLRQQGQTLREIGESFGISRQRVHQLLQHPALSRVG